MTPPAPSVPKIRVLYLDDYVHDRALIKDVLEREHGGFEVSLAASGPEFEARLDDGSFDVVLTDFHVVGFDAIQILDLVRAKRPSLSVVVVTGSGSEELAVEALKRGADDYILKSAKHLARLPQALLACVARRRLQEERDLALQEANRFFEQSPELLLIADLAFGVRRVNAAFTEATGYTVEDLRAVPWLERVHPEDVAQAQAAAQVLQSEGAAAIECRYLCKDGTYRWFKWQVRVDRPRGLIYAGLRDVTERREQEATRARLAAVLEATTDFVGTASGDGSVLYLNRAGRDMIGKAADEDLSQARISDVHPRWAASIIENVAIPAALAQGAWSGETAFLHRDGSEIPVSQVIIAHRSSAGRIEFLSTVARSLSERKQAEENLLQQKAFTESLINSLPGVFYLFDQDGRFLRWNRNLETVSGHSSGEIASLHPLEFIAEEDRPLVRERIGEVFEQGETGVEALLLTKDGRRIPYTFVGVRIEVEGRPCLVGTGLDITNMRNAQEALRKSEEQLGQARKLEAVGQLAGGIAHDFNNVLGVITGYCDLLLRDMGSLDPRTARVEQIGRARWKSW